MSTALAEKKTTARPTQVVTGKVRLSYANIWEPKAMPGQEPKYSVAILIPKTDKDTISRIRMAIEAAKAAGARLLEVNGVMPKNVKTTIHDGDGEKPNGGQYGEECAGHWVLNASSKMAPQIIDRQMNPILDKAEVYSGCYARVSVNFYAFNGNGNKGIGCGLGNIQKIADGEPMGGRTRAQDDFTPYTEDDAPESDFMS